MSELSKVQNKITDRFILDFCQDLEKGDLAIRKIIQKGYLLFGQVRSGKTASSHLLSGNLLKGVKIKGEQKVQLTTSKYCNNEISNTINSQTTVPNFFEIKDPYDPQERAYIIDTPGYGTTKGPLKILVNGYFHYKLYSKVKNIKFIICFDVNQLQNTAELFIDTIVNFTSYFKDYKDIRHQIWKSCVFLINKVEENSMSDEDIKQMLMEIEKQKKIQKSQQQIGLIKQFIRNILDQEKVFIIKKYKSGQLAQRKQLLREIDSKLIWWSRQLNPQKQEEVKMDQILFNLTKPILIQLNKSDYSRNQYRSFFMYYNKRISILLKPFCGLQDENIQPLDYVLHKLIEDAMGDPDSHQFLKTMKDCVDQNYKFLDPTLNEQRLSIQKQLFDSVQQNPNTVMTSSTNKNQRNKDKSYIVKKFEFLKTVQQIRSQTDRKIYILNSDKKVSKIDILDTLSNQLLKIIKQFKNVTYERQNCQDIVYKYGYLIYRLLNEAKVIRLLIETSQYWQVLDGNSFTFQIQLRNYLDCNYFYKGKFQTYNSLLQQYIKNVYLKNPKFAEVPINWSLVDLFTSTQTQNDQVIIQKVTLLIQKFIKQYLAKGQIKQQNLQDVYKLIKYLTIARVNSYQMFDWECDQNKKFKYFFLVKKITKSIGFLLSGMKKYQLERKVYHSIMFVDRVCALYQKQIEELNTELQQSEGQDKAFRIRIEYGKYLMQNGRQANATKIFQQAYQLTQNQEQFLIVKQLLKDVMLQKGNDGTKSAYERNMFEGNFLERFDEQLINELQNLGANIMPQSQIIAD